MQTEIHIGKKRAITATPFNVPPGTAVVWSTLDAGVADVDISTDTTALGQTGFVVAHGFGTTKITASGIQPDGTPFSTDLEVTVPGPGFIFTLGPEVDQ